jgi:tRNA nucleotidyltransferase (CCA-adding enzyme)
MSNLKSWQAGKDILHILQNAGFEAFIVGGAVRDIVLGKEATDIDIATSALPEDVKQVFPKTIDVGIAHGTLVVLHQDEAIEVTTFRTDGDYADHRRPNGVVFVSSLEEDLKRRDFTMNALAMTVDEEVIDLFGGITDIHNKMIRTVGNSNQRFSEDALRMLRGVRFSAQLGFHLEEMTSRAIKKQASDIKHISVERITKELEKIWISKNPYLGIKLLEETRIAENLPGYLQWDHRQWLYFNAHQSAVNGWAFLSLLQEGTDVLSISNIFKLSNHHKQTIKQIVRAAKVRMEDKYSVEHIYEFDEKTLVIAEEYVRILHPTIEPMNIENIKEMKRSLPIQSNKDLAVTGTDLINWMQKPGGPWIHHMLNDLVKAILYKEVNNHPEQIKEWIMK